MNEKQDNKPSNVRIARTSEERISGMLMGALENFDCYFNIAMGIEQEQLEGSDFGGDITNRAIITRRASALITSLNTLKQIIRIARPIISETIDLSKKENDAETLGEIRDEVNEILERINYANESPTLNDDLVLEKETVGDKYATYTYHLTKNFRQVTSDTEICFEEIYKIVFRNGLLTKPKTELQRRSKLNEL